MSPLTLLFAWHGFWVGGTEVGISFGAWGLGRFWALMTPILAILILPLLGSVWNNAQLRANWEIGGASTKHRLLDIGANFGVGWMALPVLSVPLLIFQVWRTGVGFVEIESALVVWLAGPVLGSLVVLGVAYYFGSLLGGHLGCISIGVGLVLLDVVGQLPFAALSISGTSKRVMKEEVWSPALSGDVLSSVSVDPSFVFTRLLICGAVALLISVGHLREAQRDQLAHRAGD